MELQLKNIGMIKEANVKLDRLTVIAGENDTGKSTVGKALYLALKSMPYKDTDKNLLGRIGNVGTSLIFNLDRLPQNSVLRIKKDSKIYSYDCQVPVMNISSDSELKMEDLKIKEILFIETPLIWNLMKLFNEIPLLESTMKIFISYPYFLKDLHLKLSFKSDNKDGISMHNKLIKLMSGEFKKDNKGDFFFSRKNQNINLINTATGIKYFGIFQVLSQNNYLNKDTVLVLDEPEVHLHPKWQLEMAKVIVELVKNGVKVLVNSHSPYMIEALKRYSKIEGQEDKTNFYLAEDGYIKQINDSNSETLSRIFEKLAEPFDVFDEMDSKSMEKLNNG